MFGCFIPVYTWYEHLYTRHVFKSGQARYTGIYTGSKISQSVSNASHVNTRHQISKGGSSPLKKHEKVFKNYKRLQNNTFTF